MKYSQQIKQPKNLKDDFSEDLGCHWSDQPGELVVNLLVLELIMLMIALKYILIVMYVAALGHWTKLRIMPVAR